MDDLTRQVGRAQRRLFAQRLLEGVGWGWSIALVGAVALIGAARIWPLGVDDALYWAVALAAGTFGVVGWAFAGSSGPMMAALEIDRRHGLKERVSSALGLSVEELATPAGQALYTDAISRLRRVDLMEKFPLRLPRTLLLPLLPATMALGLMRLPLAEPVAMAEAEQPPAPAAAEVEKSAEVLRRQLAERREQSERQGLKDATELLKRLEQGTKELAAQPSPEKALVKLNDLARELQRRRQSLGGAEQIRQQLQQVKSADRGAAAKLAQALNRGDFGSAAAELEKLRQQAADSRLSPEQKEQLAQQFDQMRQKIEQLAAANRAAQQDLQRQDRQNQQAGGGGQADSIEQQLRDLANKAPGLKDLSDTLGQCSEGLRQGDAQQARQALDQAAERIGQLGRELAEGQAMDEAMDRIAEARQKMAGGPSEPGAEEQQGAGAAGGAQPGGDAKDAPGEEDLAGLPGGGIGSQPGAQVHSKQKLDAKFYDSRAPSQAGPGSARVIGEADGPNVRGRVTAEIQQEAEAVRRGSADPLSGRKLPKKHAEHAREYFDRLREGQ